MAACLALLLTACGGDDGDATETGEGVSRDGERVDGVLTRNLEDPGTPPQDGGALAFGLEAETDGWNPIVNRWAVSGHYVASAIFDTMAVLDDEGQVVPHLAESFESNEDATEWTITLRPDVTFHDGAPLTAEAVATGLEAHRTSVLTAKAVIAIEEITMPDGPDGHTVVLRMNESWQTFPYTLTGQAGYVVPLNMTRDLNTILEPAGTGPFKFVQWDPDVSTIVEKNEDYWREGLPHLDEITFLPIVDGGERYAALQAGELDMMITRTPTAVSRLQTSDFKVISDNDEEENMVLMNHAKPPFDDLDARKAMVQAIDMNRFMEESGRGEVGEIARGPFAEGSLGYSEDDGYLGYDLDAAKASAAAYQAKSGAPLAFQMIAFDEVEYQQAQQTLVTMWTEAGIEVELVPMRQADSVLKIALGDFQAASFRMFGQPNPDSEFTFWHSRSIDDPVSLNWARFANPVVDDALLRSRGTTDPAVSQEAMAEVARTFNQEAAYLWLDRVNWALAADPRVHGIGAAGDGTLSSLGYKPWLAELWVG